MDTHTELFDMNTLEGQRAAYKARRARMARPQQKLVMTSPAAPEVAQRIERPTEIRVPSPVMVVPGSTSDVVERQGITALLSPGELEMIRQYRGTIVGDRAAKFRRIEAEVCAAYDVSRTDLWSARRPQNWCMARQEAYYRLRSETGRSLPDIGRRCGNRDHTTVLHGCRKVAALLASGTWRMKTLPDVTGYDDTLGAYTLDPSAELPIVETGTASQAIDWLQGASAVSA